MVIVCFGVFFVLAEVLECCIKKPALENTLPSARWHSGDAQRPGHKARWKTVKERFVFN